MPFEATVLRVLIASPGDVQEERDVIPEVLHTWNADNSLDKKIVLMPVMWEKNSYPVYEKDSYPQGLLNEQLVDDCDIVIGMFFARLGTPTREADSGTLEEIERSAKAGKTVAVYFSQRSVKPGEYDHDQWLKVQEFKMQLQQEGITFDYDNTDHFKELLRVHLNGLVKRAIDGKNKKYQKERNRKDAENGITTETIPSLISMTKRKDNPWKKTF